MILRELVKLYGYSRINDNDKLMESSLASTDLNECGLFNSDYRASLEDKLKVANSIAVSDDINYVEIEVHNLDSHIIYHSKAGKNTINKINIKAAILLRRCNNELTIQKISDWIVNLPSYDYWLMEGYKLTTKKIITK